MERSGSRAHIPVLLEAVLENSLDEGARPAPRWYFDGTFGRGGHCWALMQRYPELQVIALDRDEEALTWAQSPQSPFGAAIQEGRLRLFRANFSEFRKLYQSHFDQVTQGQGFDLMLLDLGVSSPQLDQGERGFSFYQDGPLDMRMDQRQDLTAAKLINRASAEELTQIFLDLGEIRKPHRVVHAIVEQRAVEAIRTTGQLAALIERVEGWRVKGQNPSTRYFLALRMKVNDELEHLQDSLEAMIESLSLGGRLMVISFHSLEDRIVKSCFRESIQGYMVNKKVIQASWSEQKQNPRARSAKLRIFQKGPLPERKSKNKYPKDKQSNSLQGEKQ